MHASKEKVCLIIPCYNEEKRLRLSEFLSGLDFCSFLFVNDGSTDRTVNLIKRVLNERILLLDLENNVGKAEAVRLGMLYASQNPPLNGSEWIGFWDADLATPLSEIEGFLSYASIHRGDVEAVWGSRVHRLGSSIRRNYRRHILGRVFATIAGSLLGIRSYDSQCGAKLFKSALIPEAFSEPFLSKWLFDIELIMRLQRRNIIEYPLRRWSDISQSKLNILSEAADILLDLIKIRIRYGRIKAFDSQ